VIKEITMSRNKLGQFEPGTCGNSRGRPRKIPRKIRTEQIRKEFLEVAGTPVPIIENGRRKLIPIRVAIGMQLAKKAASGDLRAILAWTDMDRKHTTEYVKEQLEYHRQIMKSEEIVRKHPEDVTDEYMAMIRNLRATMDPDYLP
jgi:Family of unknown function (DUF5681)